MPLAPPRVGLVGLPPADLEQELAAAGVPAISFPLRLHAGRVELLETGRVREPDVLVVHVPVPLTAAGGADTEPLADTARALGRPLRPGQLVVVTGFVPPGTTRRVVAPALAEGGPAGILVAYAARTTTGRVVAGIDDPAGQAATDVFARLRPAVTRLPTSEAAEACGTVGAVVRTVHAALATELHRACERLGADGRAVFAAAGHSDLLPYCLGEDAAALFASGCRRVRAEGRLLPAALAVNAGVSDVLAERVVDALNAAGRAVRGSRVVLVCGPGETATNPAAGVIQRLLTRGAAVRVHDPVTPFLPDDWAAEHCVVLLSDPPVGWVTTALPTAVVDAR